MYRGSIYIHNTPTLIIYHKRTQHSICFISLKHFCKLTKQFEILQKNTTSFTENNFSVLFRYNSTKTGDFIPNKLERNPLSNKLYYEPSSIQQILIEVYIILFICQNFSCCCIYLIVVFFIPKIELNIVYYSPIILIQFRFYKTYIRSLFFGMI